jgi:hypothetical protein
LKNCSDFWGRPSRTLVAGNESSINAQSNRTKDEAVESYISIRQGAGLVNPRQRATESRCGGHSLSSADDPLAKEGIDVAGVAHYR